MKKILLISESINENDSSGSKANVALIQNLKKAGFELLVYHYTRKNIQLEGIECYAITEKKNTVNYFLSRTQRYFTKFTNIHLHKFFEKIFGFSFTFFNDCNSISTSLKEKRIKDFNPDLVITLSKGASFRPHYAMLSIPELHSKWLAYIHDPYPMHYYPRPYNWVEDGYKYKEKFFQKMEQKANYFGFPSKLLMEWMGSYFPEMYKKGVIIPHQNSNTKIINNLPDFFEKDKFTLLHAGSLMKQRDPKWLIEAFLQFSEENKEVKNNIQLLLIGNHDYHKSLLEKYKNHSNIYIQGYLDYNLTQNLQNQVSVNIILEAKSEISPFLPGKFPHCVQADKPILLLSPFYSETRRLLGNEYPYWAEVDEVEKIKNHISKLYALWKENKNELKLNRKDLETYCDVENLKNTFSTL